MNVNVNVNGHHGVSRSQLKGRVCVWVGAMLRMVVAACAVRSAAGISAVAPNARRLILVRHGAVDSTRGDPPIKPGGFYGGNVEVPLSKVGEAEALNAAKMIAAEHRDEVKGIWSSPMRRALFGARAVGTAIAAAAEVWTPPMQIETDEAFREVDRGPIGIGWTNLTPEEIEVRDGPDAIQNFALEKVPGAFREVNGGEGFCDLQQRVLSKRDACLRALPLGTAGVIVSHMWVTRVMASEALGEANPLKVDVPTASVSVIDYPEGFDREANAAGICPPPVVQYIGRKPLSTDETLGAKPPKGE